MSDNLILSVLDLATVAEGKTEADAVNESVALAQLAEKLGYARFWTAEHHSMPAIASSSPDLIALRIADTTSRLRVGAGGVMLPNHAPLQVAERYLTLEAFHPGRIDLGIGRAPGTDQAAAIALRRADAAGYHEQLAELDAYLSGSAAGPGRQVTAVPRGESRPSLFLLGSSLASAQLAASRGGAFAFAGHFAPRAAVAAMREYRARFTPGELERPYAILAVSAVVADTAEHAQWVAGAQRLAAVRFANGSGGPLPTPEAAAQHQWDSKELAVAAQLTDGQLVGASPTVRDQLIALAAETGADELMVTGTMHSLRDRARSLELIAEAFDLPARRALLTSAR